jgi:hypothetical protein
MIMTFALLLRLRGVSPRPGDAASRAWGAFAGELPGEPVAVHAQSRGLVRESRQCPRRSSGVQGASEAASAGAQHADAAALDCDACQRDNGGGDQGDQPYDDDHGRDSMCSWEDLPMSPRGPDVAAN